MIFFITTTTTTVQLRSNEGLGVLEQVLSYGKTAMSRGAHRPWALGMAVRVEEREESGVTKQTQKEGRLRVQAHMESSGGRVGRLCR